MALRLIIFLALFPIAGYAQFNDTAYIYTFGGIQNEICNQAKPTWDGGYIFIGSTNTFGAGYTSFYAIKTDSLCKLQWSNTYGGSQIQDGYSVTPTLDKGFAFLGYTNSYGAGGYDVYLVKTDSMGKMQWQKTYGGTDWDFGYSIAQTLDGGYVICGLTYSYGAGNGDMYVVRTDKNGDTLWTRAIGGKGYDVGNSVYVMQDSLYYITGVTTSFGKGDTSIYLVEINNNGKIELDTTYGTTHNTLARSINGTTNKGFVIYGSTDSIPDSTSLREYGESIIRLDSTRKIQWWDIFKSSTSGGGLGNDAVQMQNGGYLAIATTNGCGIGELSLNILRIDKSGNWQSGTCFGGTDIQYGNTIAYKNKNNVVFAGASNSPGYTAGLFDFYIVRFTSDSIIPSYILKIKNFTDTLSPEMVSNISSFGAEVNIFPNPMVSDASIIVQGQFSENYKFNLYDVFGRCIVSDVPVNSSNHGQSAGHITRNSLSSGMYFYELDGKEGKVASGKLMVE